MEVFADKVFSDALDGLTTPSFGDNPTRTDYVFDGWNPAVESTVNGNATYTATWKDDKNNNGTPDEQE
ncbi:pilus assembly protein PilY, partial [bacterium]|nr:pilus assembly protein PilY [bacterium]